MRKTFSLTIFTGGILLMILAFIANNSTSSDISSFFFHGSGNSNSIWFLVSGIAAIIVGVNGLSAGSKSIYRSFSKAKQRIKEKHR